MVAVFSGPALVFLAVLALGTYTRTRAGEQAYEQCFVTDGMTAVSPAA